MDLQRCNFWSARGKKQQKIGIKKHFVVFWRVFFLSPAQIKVCFFAFLLDWFALEGVFPFSSSDQSLLLCFLARLMCFAGCFSFLQLRSKFSSLLACSIDVLLFGSFFFEGLVFWDLLLLWWCSSSSSSSSACVCSEINLSCFCFLGGVFWFGTFVFFWWVGFPCLFVAGFVCVCVCVCAYIFCSMWQLLEFEFLGVKVFVCLSSLERMGFWDESLLIVCGLL